MPERKIPLTLTPETEEQPSPSLSDWLRTGAGALVRGGSGFASSMGFVPGAAIAGGGELLAQLIENNFDPNKLNKEAVLLEAGLGAIPASGMLKTAAKAAGLQALATEARKYVQDEPEQKDGFTEYFPKPERTTFQKLIKPEGKVGLTDPTTDWNWMDYAGVGTAGVLGGFLGRRTEKPPVPEATPGLQSKAGLRVVVDKIRKGEAASPAEHDAINKAVRADPTGDLAKEIGFDIAKADKADSLISRNLAEDQAVELSNQAAKSELNRLKPDWEWLQKDVAEKAATKSAEKAATDLAAGKSPVPNKSVVSASERASVSVKNPDGSRRSVSAKLGTSDEAAEAAEKVQDKKWTQTAKNATAAEKKGLQISKETEDALKQADSDTVAALKQDLSTWKAEEKALKAEDAATHKTATAAQKAQDKWLAKVAKEENAATAAELERRENERLLAKIEARKAGRTATEPTVNETITGVKEDGTKAVSKQSWVPEPDEAEDVADDLLGGGNAGAPIDVGPKSPRRGRSATEGYTEAPKAKPVATPKGEGAKAPVNPPQGPLPTAAQPPAVEGPAVSKSAKAPKVPKTPKVNEPLGDDVRAELEAMVREIDENTSKVGSPMYRQAKAHSDVLDNASSPRGGKVRSKANAATVRERIQRVLQNGAAGDALGEGAIKAARQRLASRVSHEAEVAESAAADAARAKANFDKLNKAAAQREATRTKPPVPPKLTDEEAINDINESVKKLVDAGVSVDDLEKWESELLAAHAQNKQGMALGWRDKVAKVLGKEPQAPAIPAESSLAKATEDAAKKQSARIKPTKEEFGQALSQREEELLQMPDPEMIQDAPGSPELQQLSTRAAKAAQRYRDALAAKDEIPELERASAGALARRLEKAANDLANQETLALNKDMIDKQAGGPAVPPRKGLRTRNAKNQTGEATLGLVTRLGPAVLGGTIGGAMDEEHPLRGAAIGAGLGFAAPSLAQAVSEGKLPQKMAQKYGELGEFLPSLQRFNLLTSPDSLAANVFAGPYGSGIMGSVEAIAAKDPRGMKALKLLTPANWYREFKAASQEAIAAIGATERGERMVGETIGPVDKFLATPGTWMTQADMATRNILMKAGFSAEEARRITLTSEPKGALALNLAHAGKSATPGGIKSDFFKLMLPFKRTAANIVEQGVERTPVLGSIYQRFGKDAADRDSWERQGVQQGLGASVAFAAYQLGKHIDQDPTTERYWRKFVSNAAGPYSMLASAGLAAGMAARDGEPFAKMAGKATTSMLGDMPLPTTQTPNDTITSLLKLSSGEVPHPNKEGVGRWLPRAAYPGFIDLIGSEFSSLLDNADDENFNFDFQLEE